MSNAPTTSADRLTLDRLREYQRVIEALSRIGPQALSAQQLMQHVTVQVSRATMIPRTSCGIAPRRATFLLRLAWGGSPASSETPR
jgi:hypothetical protein